MTDTSLAAADTRRSSTLTSPGAESLHDHSAYGDYCVYTTLLGQYEELNELPAALVSGIPFTCLTDDPKLRSATWQIRLVDPALSTNPVRSQRDIKIRPHVHLPDFGHSDYIDNWILLKAPPERLLGDLPAGYPIALPRHSYRESVLDEFFPVAQSGLDDSSRVFE